MSTKWKLSAETQHHWCGQTPEVTDVAPRQEGATSPLMTRKLPTSLQSREPDISRVTLPRARQSRTRSRCKTCVWRKEGAVCWIITCTCIFGYLRHTVDLSDQITIEKCSLCFQNSTSIIQLPSFSEFHHLVPRLFGSYYRRDLPAVGTEMKLKLRPTGCHAKNLEPRNRLEHVFGT